MVGFFTMRLVAPEATFRGLVVGENVAAQPIPSPSLLTGLIGAALGIRRHQGADLRAIQEAASIAWLVHREPVVISDFQTANLKSPHMLKAWENDGDTVRVVRRGGGDQDRKIANRDMTCEVDLTAIVGWKHPDLSAQAVLDALDQPVWHLSLGARTCLPSEPIGGEIVEAASLREATDRVAAACPGIAVYEPLGLGEMPTSSVLSLASRVFDPANYAKFGGQTRYNVRSLI